MATGICAVMVTAGWILLGMRDAAGEDFTENKYIHFVIRGK